MAMKRPAAMMKRPAAAAKLSEDGEGEDGAETTVAAPSTAAFEDFSTSFESRLEKFQAATKDMQADEMEPHLRRFFKDSEISNYWNKIKREIVRLNA